jgi:ABC-2 type transport system ATP-binding protein
MTLAVDVAGLGKRFSGKVAVDGVDLRLEAGRVYGFLGPNGSGKTTTLRLLCGIVRPDRGEGACLGFDIRAQSAQIKRRTGYVTQDYSLYDDLTVAENLAFVARARGVRSVRERVEAALGSFDLADRRRQLAGALSGGWRQRLALASATIHGPDLLLLDEPTSGLDLAAKRWFWDAVQRLATRGATALVCTHDMDEAERCQEIVCFDGGRILAQGSAAQIIAQAAVAVFAGDGEGVLGLAAQLRAAPAVRDVAVVGQTLRVSGDDSAALAATLAGCGAPAIAWREAPSSLEDALLAMTGRRRRARAASEAA